MPWFRLKRKKDDEAAQRAAVGVAAPAEQPGPSGDEQEDDEHEIAATPPVEGDGAPRPRRRRGSRGGRGRRKPGTAPAEEVGAEPVASPAQVSAEGEVDSAEKSERSPASRTSTRRRSGQQQRRKQPPRRAPLPSAKRELLITVDVGEQRVAILEDDRVAEVFLERPERRSIAGNIYLGTVDNVLPGMEAAFVEIGLEKNGFLYVDEIVVPELEGKRHGKKITDLIDRGQQLLVQAVKDPMKTKGARLTTEISLPGRFLVYVPNGEGLGVSRRLEDSERQRLKEILKNIATDEGGVIVRTAAEGASAEDIERDLVFLQRLWKTIQARATSAKAPELVYQEAELPLRIVRDLFAGDFVSASVDNDRAHKRIVSYLKKTSPHMIERVHRSKEKEPLFERYGVEREIASTLERRVDLPSGGYLIFDYAEAFTVVDVNTGRFVGSRSKNSTQRLEDTIVKNNLEAVKEVVRQLRLRDIGGIIVIDFIDMANPKNRQAVEEALRSELERDRTKTYVVEISPLGLVEMTRQNVTDGPREIMTRKCPTCAGDGIVVSDATTAMLVERKLRALASAGAGSRVQAYRVGVHPHTLALLVGPGGARLAALEEASRRRFFLVGIEGHVHTDRLEVLAEGRLADLQPASPVAEGADLELKLVEVGLHDATTGVGKVDGVDVIVGGAAKLVGKKVLVRVGRALEGQVFATLVETGSASAPITFESEAEKPTRAPSRRKPADGHGELDASPDEIEVDDVPSEDAAIAVDSPLVDDEQDVDAESAAETVTKKKTRRGSRGGRRRKKPAVAAAGSTGEEEAGDAEIDAVLGAEAPEAEALVAARELDAEPSSAAKPVSTRARRAPRIHVPDDGETPPASGQDGVVDPEPSIATDPDAASADADPPPPVRKPTRRGSRGGRSRKKKSPVAVGAEGAVIDESLKVPEADSPEHADNGSDPEPAPREDEPVPSIAASESEGGYVPMSEWIDDFDGRRPR